MDADGDGIQEVYVTIVSNDELSQIWEVKRHELLLTCPITSVPLHWQVGQRNCMCRKWGVGKKISW
jgi:hypothetical protein